MNLSLVVVDSMWVWITSWFTPTLLFCFLNLMIATIFITSSFFHKSHHNNYNTTSSHEQQQQLLLRPPSLLYRMKSINFSFRRSDHHDPNAQLEQQQQQQQQESQAQEQLQYSETHHIVRSQSETTPSVEEVISKPEKRKLKKYASEKILTNNLDTLEKEGDRTEAVDRRRPATARERKEDEDEAVDRRADDFINRFREQLKLQRLDSILRYKEMINRGAGR